MITLVTTVYRIDGNQAEAELMRHSENKTLHFRQYFERHGFDCLGLYTVGDVLALDSSFILYGDEVLRLDLENRHLIYFATMKE